MNDELGRIWKGTVAVQSICYPRVNMRGLRKSTRNISQNSHYSDTRAVRVMLLAVEGVTLYHAWPCRRASVAEV
jgi:hypothetical protein